MIVVEHDMTFVRALDVKVTVLHEGSVLSEGTIDHVSDDPKVIEVYLRPMSECWKRPTSTSSTAPRRRCAMCRSRPRPARSPPDGAQRRRQDQLLARDRRRAADRQRRILFEGKPLGRMAPYERARLGIAYVPQGRDIFPLLTVKENLETGYAPLSAASGRFRPTSSTFFRCSDMLRRRGGDLSGGQQQQLAIGRALVTRPAPRPRRADRRHPAVDHQGHRPGHLLAARPGQMAILLVEQYFDFVRELADTFAVMDRGQIVLSGTRDEMDPDKVRRHLTVLVCPLLPL